MKNVLYLEKRGCNFWKDDEKTKASDVGNYRVCTPCESIPGKDGKLYCLELTHWERYNYRKTHKITGKPLKHVIKELENENALCVRTEYTEGKLSFGNLKLEEKLRALKLSYTQADILKAANIISSKNYSEILFSDSDILKNINSIAGFRELEVLKNLKSVEILQEDKSYKVYKFTDIYGNSFEYEKNRNIITG